MEIDLKSAEKDKVVKEKAGLEKKGLRYQRDRDREIVRGIFRFHEVPGGSLSFVFKKYKEDPVEIFTMQDGQQYSVPLGVAKHLNKEVAYPIHGFMKMEGSQTNMNITQMVRRCSFQSLEFIDIDGFGSESKNIITVESSI